MDFGYEICFLLFCFVFSLKTFIRTFTWMINISSDHKKKIYCLTSLSNECCVKLQYFDSVTRPNDVIYEYHHINNLIQLD